MIKGKDFENIIVEYLLYGRDFFVMFGEYVIIDVGIGCVYIVLGYGEDDFIIG